MTKLKILLVSNDCFLFQFSLFNMCFVQFTSISTKFMNILFVDVIGFVKSMTELGNFQSGGEIKNVLHMNLCDHEFDIFAPLIVSSFINVPLVIFSLFAYNFVGTIKSNVSYLMTVLRKPTCNISSIMKLTLSQLLILQSCSGQTWVWLSHKINKNYVCFS